MAKKKEQVNTIHEAKIKVREIVGKVFTDAKQAHRNYSYTSHTAVTKAVVPAMHEVGMTYRFHCDNLQIDKGFAVMSMRVSFSYNEESEACTVYCGDKLRDGTSMGSITSYGLKVALLKYFGLESGEKDLEDIQAEDDERARMKEQRTKSAAAPSTDDEHVKKTLDIFEGKIAAPKESHREQMKGLAKEDFLMLCGELGVTNEQMEARIKKEGYASLNEVSEDKLEEWNETMCNKMSELECMKDG